MKSLSPEISRAVWETIQFHLDRDPELKSRWIAVEKELIALGEIPVPDGALERTWDRVQGEIRSDNRPRRGAPVRPPSGRGIAAQGRITSAPAEPSFAAGKRP